MANNSINESFMTVDHYAIFNTQLLSTLLVILPVFIVLEEVLTIFGMSCGFTL